jgi:hypothetical protein
MSKIVKPDLTYQWASAAGGGSVAPSSGKIQTGHIVEKPNYEYMNWLQNRQDVSIAYTFQMGVPEWDSLVEYQYHANYKSYVQRNGLVYKALQVGTNKDPATEAAYWSIAFDNYGSAATVQSNLTTHITNYGTLASLSNAATARSNLGVYSYAQVDNALALKAWVGGSNTQLFLVANGTTGYEAVNKSQLDAKAALAGSSGQEFAVAAATGGNNAVNKTQLDAKTGQATETVAGITEICTDAELLAGASDVAVATPLKLRLGFAASFATNGYISFPTWLGGLILQWGEGSTDPADNTEPTQGISFSPAFTTIYQVYVSTSVASANDNCDIWYQTYNLSTTGFNIKRQVSASTSNSVVTQPRWFAIGK